MAGCENCISCGLYTLENDALAVKLQGVGGSNGVAGSFSGGLGCDPSDPVAAPVQSGLYVVVDGVTTFVDVTGKVTAKNPRRLVQRTTTGTQSIPNTPATTTITWPAATENTGGVFSTVVGPGAIVLEAGVYAFTYRANYTATLAGTNHYVRWLVNGSGVGDVSIPVQAALGGAWTVTLMLPLAVNAQVDVALHQNSGGAATHAAGGYFVGTKVSE